MEINIFSRKSIKSLKTRIFTLAFGSTGRAVATFTVIAIVVTMGILGGSGKLLQPVPSAGPFVGDATYHVMVTPAAIPVGHTTTIIASVDAFIANTVLDVEVTVVGPHGSGILGIENTTISTDSHGNGYVMLAYPGSFKPSASTNAVGTYLVSATFTYGYTTAYAYSHFVVFKNAVFAAPQLYITPGFGPVGTTVDVYGYHFAPDANITLYYDGIAVSNGSVPKTNATGFFSLTFTVPTSTGLNKVTAVDQYNNTATAYFEVQPSSQPGPLESTATQALVINGSAIANFTQTIGMEVLITGSNLSNGTSIGIIGSIYSEMPLNVVKPKTSDSLFYDVKVLNVSSGNATVSITESFVKTEHMNTMEYWNGTAWVQASSIVVVNDTIQGVIPVKELQKTPIVIGYIAPPSHLVVYLVVGLVVVAVAIILPLIILRRRRLPPQPPQEGEQREQAGNQ